MSFSENLFLNYVPLAAIIGGLVWYFRRPKQRAAPPTLPSDVSPPKVPPLPLPETKDRLPAFARDMSGGNEQFVAFVDAMMAQGALSAGAPEEWEIWDADLFPAVPYNKAKRWNQRALRATKQTDGKHDIYAHDAYFMASYFIEDARPAGVDYFEGRTGDRPLSVTHYWEAS